jgi:hypothetical protein
MKSATVSSVRTAMLLTAMAVLAGGVSLQADDSRLLNKDDLKHLVSTETTTQDHQRLAAQMKHQMSGQTAGHCDYFAASMHKAAMNARRLASEM